MVWRCILQENITRAQQELCLRLMEPSRRAAVERISHKDVRESTINGEWLAKTMLSERSGRPVEDILLARDKDGKPYAENLPLHFSISHSGAFVACAVSDTPVGLDLEEIRHRDITVARRICSEREMAFILGGEDPLKRFLKVWTAKEAYVKLTGIGIKGMREADYFALQPRLQVIERDEYIITVCRP